MATTEHIQVAVRVRPFTNRELERNCECVVTCSSEQTLCVQSDAEPKTFTFDFAYWSVEAGTPQYVTQQMVYADLGASLLGNALSGYDACMFAYGQTGTGKTYTMMGFGSEESDLGIFPRTMETLFQQKASIEAPGPASGELRIWVSSIELSNEYLRDLLQPDRHGPELRVSDHPEHGVCVPGLVAAPCRTVTDVRKLIAFATARRATSTTNMNGVSSRSHVIFTVRLQRFMSALPVNGAKDDRMAFSAKMNFVDLAGSERIPTPCDNAPIIREGCSINQSLSALGIVVKALNEQQSAGSIKNAIVPFRSSRLTLLLKGALCGDSKTFMIGTVSPASDSISETISTLRFASSVNAIKTAAVASIEQSTEQSIHSLQAEMRRLRAKRAALLSSSADFPEAGTAEDQVREELMQRNYLLQQMLKPYDNQLEESVQLEEARETAFNELGIAFDLNGQTPGTESDTPYLLNISSDPILAGCLVYYLQPSCTTTVGSSPENSIVLSGLGIPEFLCQIENLDQQILAMSVAPAFEEAAKAIGGGIGKAPVRTNGVMLRIDERRLLQHFDCIIIGRAHGLRLIVPVQQKLLANSGAIPRTDMGLYEENMLRMLIPDESEAWGELRLYFTDLWQRLGEDRGREFFGWLTEASYYVDEANEITGELRPGDRLKFEVELVWDIHREPCDIIVVRAMQFPLEDGDATVLCYWTLETFKDRVAMMRDCYDIFHRTGEWVGRGDAFEDPWMDPSAIELSLRMNTLGEDQLRKHDERYALLAPEMPEGGSGISESDTSLATRDAGGAAGRSSTSGAKARAAAKNRAGGGRDVARSARAQQPSPRPQAGIERSTPGRPLRGKTTPARGPGRGENVSESRPPFGGGGSGTRQRSVSSERQPPSLESERRRVLPATDRPSTQTRGVPQGVSSDPLAQERLEEPVTPQATEFERVVEVVSRGAEPDAEPPSKDALIATLRARLLDREAREEMYKGKIAGLYQTLALKEKLHGSLITLRDDRQLIQPGLPQTFSAMLGSAATLPGSSTAALGSVALTQPSLGTALGPITVFGRTSPPSGGRLALSGRLEGNSSTAAVLAAVAAGLGPQRQLSWEPGKSAVPQFGPILPIAPPGGPVRASSAASNYISSRGLPQASIITAGHGAPAPPMHHMLRSPPLQRMLSVEKT